MPTINQRARQLMRGNQKKATKKVAVSKPSPSLRALKTIQVQNERIIELLTALDRRSEKTSGLESLVASRLGLTQE